MLRRLLKNKRVGYWAPLVMLIIGVILYSYILPARYNKVVGLIDWLFSGSDTIIATLRSADIVLGQAYRIILTKCIVWLWTLGFLISLYMCGYAWHHRGEEYKEADDYIGDIWKPIFQDILTHARTMKDICDDSTARDLYHVIRNLGERLEAIHDFGRGNAEVLLIEKNIVNELRILQEKFTSITTAESFHTEWQSLITHCNRIQNNLIKRNNMQKICS